jgi:ppGpp synthetase/RelA/SpoT-type nucleotidyltranferase
MQIVTHIIFYERKSVVPEQVGDILDPSGEEVVHADHGMSGLQQQIGEMTPEKPGSACNKDTHTMILLLRSSHRECHEINQNR